MTRRATPPTALQQAGAFATIFVLAQRFSRLGDNVLAPLDLTTKQWLLLAVIAKRFAGREPTLTEVAKSYGSSRQNVKQIAEQLEGRGWLRLVPDPDDRRAVRLRLTQQMARFDEPAHVARERQFFELIFAGLRDREVAVLYRLLTRWLQSLTGPVAGAR